MLRIKNIKVDYKKDSVEEIKKQIAKNLNANTLDIKGIKINKKSIDARFKPNIKYVYEIDFEIKNEEKYKNIDKVTKEEYIYPKKGNLKLKHRPVIVGAGPAGLFAGFILTEQGYNPIIIERGKKIEDRINDVEEFWKTGILDINSNVQFGEGGAGTFSDGKLNTLKRDINFRMKKVFETFVQFGAPKEILYDYRPHIGTDKLRNVIRNMREYMIKKGAIFKYETCLTNIYFENDKIKEIEVNNKEKIECDALVLAIGHSARDTFYMLNNKLKMEPKPFAVGVRIMHQQKVIDKSQYGESNLTKASYKLTYQASNKRGVYSFCMCPGGYVVNASSEENKLAINGMSNYARESENANSAIVVTISPKDYGTGTFDGVKFQRILEEKAYNACHGRIPIQLYKDFKENKISKKIGTINPIIKGDYDFYDLNLIFPNYINESLKEGIEYFGKKIKGFNNNDAILCAVESRTSSPIRINRDDFFESNIKGIYPCGEGAGYAGGITTSAMDGIKVAEKIIEKYK